MKQGLLLIIVFTMMCKASSGQQQVERLSLTELSQDSAMLESFRKGVEVMKARKPSDPTSWFFQAAIHGVDSTAIAEARSIDSNIDKVDINKFWNQCPHNGESSAAFLPWHRAYLHYFEEILREASGNPDLALPYWDYSGAERSFPEIFAVSELVVGTDTIPNPLFDNQRELVFMFNLYELSDRVVTTNIIFNEENFFGRTERSGLAGGVYDSDPGTKGLIERQPHDLMHISIGGMIGDSRGAMSAVMTAAFDPIFWVHHSNIDKLWADWEALPNKKWGSIPSESWFNRTWDFYNKDRQVESKSISHWLQYKNMSYTYSGSTLGVSRLSDVLPHDYSADTTLLATTISLPKNLNEGLLSTKSATQYTFQTIDDNKTIDRLVENQANLVLEIEFTIPDDVPTVGYEVFVEINGVEKSLGVLSFFGLEHHASHHGHSTGMEMHHESSNTFKEQFDIDPSVLNKGFNSQDINVSIRPFSLYKAQIEMLSDITRSGGVQILSSTLKIE